MKGINFDNIDWGKINKTFSAVRVIAYLFRFAEFMFHHLDHMLF